MQYLKKVNKYYYELLGEPKSKTKRYVFTSKETREICNKPEVLGCEYTSRMSSAMAKALKHLPINILELNENETCVMNFLRGGLNFDLRIAINKAYGFNTHSTSFMSSQRFKVNNRWDVKENQYRKFIFPRHANIFIGDVIATGVTVEHGIEVMLEEMKKNGSSLKNIFFFTIGCHKAEKVFDKFYDQIKRDFKDFKNIYIIYLEGKFKLADSKTKLRINIPGTDLLRTDALLSPEFELSQYESLPYCLERCTIYDAGSRAYDIPEYSKDVMEYWHKVLELADKGFTLYDACKERWKETDYENYNSFCKIKKQQWQGIDEDFLKKLYVASKKRQSYLALKKTSGPLKELCQEKIERFTEFIR